MRVRLRLFASLADLAGVSELEVELSEGARLSELRATLGEMRRDFAAGMAGAVWAVDRCLVQGDPVLRDGAEVAVMPPFSGG
jgi:molybdopterin converting factor small subunit